MTPASIISDARYILNDTRSAAYRQTDTELLQYVNDGLKECVILRPELFSIVQPITCQIGVCEQSIAFAQATVLLEVLCITGGTALLPFDFDTMNAVNPGWRTDTAGAAKQWCKHANDPLRFYVYPAAPATPQVLDVRYVRNSPEYGLTDLISAVPSTYASALTDYVVYRASSKDDEFQDNGRSTAFYQSFVSKMKGA